MKQANGPALNWNSTMSINGKTIDPQKLANGGYNVSIVLSASKDGDVFQGAPGSTLLIDDLELVCKQPLR